MIFGVERKYIEAVPRKKEGCFLSKYFCYGDLDVENTIQKRIFFGVVSGMTYFGSEELEGHRGGLERGFLGEKGYGFFGRDYTVFMKPKAQVSTGEEDARRSLQGLYSFLPFD